MSDDAVTAAVAEEKGAGRPLETSGPISGALARARARQVTDGLRSVLSVNDHLLTTSAKNKVRGAVRLICDQDDRIADLEGLAPVPVKVGGATFEISIRKEGIALLMEARNLFREYEDHHRERASEATSLHRRASEDTENRRWLIEQRNASEDKAKRNADIAERIERFLDDPVRVDDADPIHTLSLKLIADLRGLITDSEGVYGLHRNGDPAPWDEILRGGAYEDRLKSFDALSDVFADIDARGEKPQKPVEEVATAATQVSPSATINLPAGLTSVVEALDDGRLVINIVPDHSSGFPRREYFPEGRAPEQSARAAAMRLTRAIGNEARVVVGHDIAGAGDVARPGAARLTVSNVRDPAGVPLMDPEVVEGLIAAATPSVVIPSDVWGPEISVDAIERPIWVGSDTEFMRRGLKNGWVTNPADFDPNWSRVAAIRLRPDHPHYADIDAMIRGTVSASDEALPLKALDPVPIDVAALVVAGRSIWQGIECGSPPEPEELRAFGKALEAFAERVPYDDEPATPFTLSTPDPKFDPAAPIVVNGYTFHPAKEA